MLTHHEESDERRQQLVHLASFWAGCSQCGDHWHSNRGVGECLAEVSRLREVVIKLAACDMWSNRVVESSPNVGMDAEPLAQQRGAGCSANVDLASAQHEEQTLPVAENDAELRATRAVPDHTLLRASEPSHGVKGLNLERRSIKGAVVQPQAVQEVFLEPCGPVGRQQHMMLMTRPGDVWTSCPGLRARSFHRGCVISWRLLAQ